MVSFLHEEAIAAANGQGVGTVAVPVAHQHRVATVAVVKDAAVLPADDEAVPAPHHRVVPSVAAEGACLVDEVSEVDLVPCIPVHEFHARDTGFVAGPGEEVAVPHATDRRPLGGGRRDARGRQAKHQSTGEQEGRQNGSFY